MFAKQHRKKESRLRILFMSIIHNPRQMVNQLTVASKLVNRRYRRLPFVAQFALIVSFLLAVLFYGSALYWLFGNPLTSDSFMEVDKCPACFGFKLCDVAHSGNVWFTGWSRIRLLDYANLHNVHNGMADGRPVILKKLGRNQDITAWENRLCQIGRQPSYCDVSAAATRGLMASGTKWMTKHLTGMSNMTACPTDRLLEKIMDRYYEKLDSIDLSARERIQLISTLMLNQETIIFQTFPRSEGWPFPSYVGACGRYVAIAADWLPLHRFYNAEWTVRAQLALKMLEIANRFTENKSQYGLYFTDINYGTFGVDEKTSDLLVVNARHIMVVDRYSIKYSKNSGWDEPLFRDFDSCPSSDECHLSSVNAMDLCLHHETDHNYYAVCRFMLSPYAVFRGQSVGLLHDVPSEIDTIHAITELLKSCAKPAPHHSRIDTASQLIKALTDVVGLHPMDDVKQ